MINEYNKINLKRKLKIKTPKKKTEANIRGGVCVNTLKENRI